jgi:hypothetical protein
MLLEARCNSPWIAMMKVFLKRPLEWRDAGTWAANGVMTVRHCRSVVAQQLLIYKGIASSERVRRQVRSAYEPRILGKGADHDQDPL